MFDVIKQDFARYRTSRGFAWYEPSLWAVVCYRFGKWGQRCPWGLRQFLKIIHLPLSIAVTLLTGIQLPRTAKIGPGLRIYHFGCIVVHPEAVIGMRCTLRHEVTIGTCRSDHDVPVVGNSVEFGAGAKVLGNIRVGNNVTIGANSVVLTDVPDNCIAVGAPARIIPKDDTCRHECS